MVEMDVPPGFPVPAPPPDLAGPIEFKVSDSHSTFLMNTAVVLVEHQPVPKQRYAAWQPVPRLLLADLSALRFVLEQLLQRLRPWTRPDRNPLPYFVLFPALDRVEAWLRRKTRRAR